MYTYMNLRSEGAIINNVANVRTCDALRFEDGFFSMTEDSDDDDPLPAGRRGNGRAQAIAHRKSFCNVGKTML